ncbi:MAG TPA: DUF6093 family protein [Jiangellales bacterium]|nr:DUF6093 family protein [Jiangellales bacterium]
MSVESLLARGRAAAEKLMQDTCTIRHRTGETTDPTSGVVTPTYSTVYTGPCRVQQASPAARATDAGEAELLLLSRVLQVPMSATGIRAGDRVTIDTSALDPDLDGRVFVVRGEFAKTHATSRRFGIEEVTS